MSKETSLALQRAIDTVHEIVGIQITSENLVDAHFDLTSALLLNAYRLHKPVRIRDAGMLSLIISELINLQLMADAGNSRAMKHLQVITKLIQPTGRLEDRNGKTRLISLRELDLFLERARQAPAFEHTYAVRRLLSYLSFLVEPVDSKCRCKPSGSSFVRRNQCSLDNSGVEETDFDGEFHPHCDCWVMKPNRKVKLRESWKERMMSLPTKPSRDDNLGEIILHVFFLLDEASKARLTLVGFAKKVYLHQRNSMKMLTLPVVSNWRVLY